MFNQKILYTAVSLYEGWLALSNKHKIEISSSDCMGKILQWDQNYPTVAKSDCYILYMAYLGL